MAYEEVEKDYHTIVEEARASGEIGPATAEPERRKNPRLKVRSPDFWLNTGVQYFSPGYFPLRDRVRGELSLHGRRGNSHFPGQSRLHQRQGRELQIGGFPHRIQRGRVPDSVRIRR